MNTKDILKSGVAVLAIAWSLSGTSWATDPAVIVGITPPSQTNQVTTTISQEEQMRMRSAINTYKKSGDCNPDRRGEHGRGGCQLQSTRTLGEEGLNSGDDNRPDLMICLESAIQKNEFYNNSTNDAYNFRCGQDWVGIERIQNPKDTTKHNNQTK